MTRQSHPDRLCKYLRVFGRRALPDFDARLLAYAEHADREVRCLANRALSRVAHPQVRRLAVERLSAGKVSEDELGLLRSNYELGDAALIEPLLRAPEDTDELHALTLDLVGLFEAHTVAESASAMAFVYEESPCSNCRSRAAGVLADSGQLAPWLREECRDDCSEATRALVMAAGSSSPATETRR